MTENANWLEILALVVLVVAAAFFAASEAALVSVSRLRARGMLERGLKKAEAVIKLLDDRNRFLTSILVANTVVLLAADSLATYIFIRNGVPDAVLVSTIIMTVVFLLFGEIIPKTVAVSDSDRWALRLAPSMLRVAVLLTPIVRSFLFLTDALVRPFGVPAHARQIFVTEEDIRTLVNVGAEQNVLEGREREMIHSVIEFGDTIVREVMTPRRDVVAVAIDESPRRALDLVIAEGYSKIPVYEDSKDDIIGVVHDRELLIAVSRSELQKSLRSLARPIKAIPENKKVDELLREMQAEKVSVAIVVDEYGGTAGLVTMEDILEEIVGEIMDESDAELQEKAPDMTRLPDGDVVVDARMNIDDVNEQLGLHLPTEDFESIGGYAFGQFGRVPLAGEQIAINDGIVLVVEKTAGRRLLSVRIKKVPHDENGRRRPAEPKAAAPQLQEDRAEQ